MARGIIRDHFIASPDDLRDALWVLKTILVHSIDDMGLLRSLLHDIAHSCDEVAPLLWLLVDPVHHIADPQHILHRLGEVLEDLRLHVLSILRFGDGANGLDDAVDDELELGVGRVLRNLGDIAEGVLRK